MSMPLFSLPLSVMVLDDNNSFLKGLEAHFSDKRSCLLANKPSAALPILNTHTCINTSLHEYLTAESLDESDYESNAHSFDFEFYQKILYNPNRFDEIGALIVDYSMPEISGLEFCREISDLPVKKIMVTAEAGHDLAVEAFNEGIIDTFIMKEPNDITAKIDQAIEKMQKRYFDDVSKMFFKEPLSSPTRSPNYQQAFNQFLENHKLVEYYRITPQGSYLGIDADGNPNWFIIESQDQIDDLIDVAHHAEADEKILDPLQSGSHLLFLLTEEEKRLPVFKWRSYLVPISARFDFDEQTYCISIINGNSIGRLNRKKIQGLNQHLAKEKCNHLDAT